ncbi:MAG TPA: gluconate 2-dehydrogenase subunit 3 family protein [Steroidobacteraceae bacterium]|nr:gluconate 2-dehydrogenase subunit 3 family protein [Steroidobacteraceae bacterium]
MDRRTSIKWVLAASAAWPLGARHIARAHSTQAAHGYGTDPDLLPKHHPGEFWPLTLSPSQRQLAAALSDLIIPADEHSPSASAVGVVDFVDEWVSAPYPANRADRPIVLKGFTWLDGESSRRFGKPFAQLTAAEQNDICGAICNETRASPALREPARFFALYRDLTAGGFYSTPAGRKDLNYIGNVALASFEGPPAELLRKLNLP